MAFNACLHVSIAVVTLLSAGGCSSSQGRANGDGAVLDDSTCSVPLPTSCPSPSPHYADVAPIIAANCAVPCHSGVPGGPWALTDYEHIADWADTIRSMVAQCQMPPPDAGVPMTIADRLAILTWIRCGSPP